jgi:hypothetical protein
VVLSEKTPFSFSLSSSASLYQTTFAIPKRAVSSSSVASDREGSAGKIELVLMPLWSFVCVCDCVAVCMVECELARERVSGTPAAVAALIWSHDVSEFNLESRILASSRERRLCKSPHRSSRPLPRFL